MVRPWAIAGPVLVLLLAAPLIRPLFAPEGMTSREAVTLESVRSVLRNGTLVLDPARVKDSTDVFHNGQHAFSLDPPVFSVILAGVGWVIERLGVDIEKNPVLHEYLLILFAITFPTAMASGLIYRMGRSFELRRWWRMVIALAAVLGTGWFSYSTVLMPLALAAAMVIVGAASVWHVSGAKKPGLAVGWLVLGGFCAAIGAAIDLNAAWMILLMPVIVLCLKLPARVRLIGLMLIIAGAAAPVVLHGSINPAITGDWWPPTMHATKVGPMQALISEPMVLDLSDEIGSVDPSFWVGVGRGLNRLLLFTVGAHGIFSHFPVLILAAAGMWMVLRRHWGRTLKWLAGGVGLATVGHLLVRMTIRADATDLSFAAPGLVAMLPVAMLFAGAWVRKSHSAVAWTLAGVALGVSVLVTIIGATGPAPEPGFTGYTAAEAAERLFVGDPPAPTPLARAK